MQILQKLEAFNQKYGVWLFYIGLALMILGSDWFWFKEEPSPQILWLKSRCMRFGTYLCWARLLLMIRQHPAYTILSLILLVIFHRQGFFISNNPNFYWILLLVLAARGAQVKKTLMIYIIGLSAMVLLANLLFLASWSADIQKHTFSLAGHSWGMGNPNLLGLTLTSIFLAALTLRRPKEEWRLRATCLFVALVIGFITLCGTAVIAILALPIFYYFVKRYSIRPIYWAAVPILCLLVSICLALYYGPSMGETTFESRFSMSYLFYLENGIEWIGQNCKLVHLRTALAEDIDAICLDNLYLRIPLEYGIIPGSIVYLFLCYHTYLIAKQQSPFLLTLVLCFLLIGFTETTTLMFRLNFSFLLGVFTYNYLPNRSLNHR